LDARIYLRDGGIAPLDYLAEVDVGQDRARQLELAGLYAFQIDDGDIAADDGRKLQQAIFFKIFRLERHVRRAEIDRLVLDLLDPATRADRLVIHTDTGLRSVGLGPLRVDRVGKSRACASDVDGGSRAADAEGQGGDGEQMFVYALHGGPLSRLHVTFA